MYSNDKPVVAGRSIAVLLVMLSAVSLEEGMVTDPGWYSLLWITVPMLVVFAWLHKKHSFEQKRKNVFSITKEQLQ